MFIVFVYDALSLMIKFLVSHSMGAIPILLAF